MAAVSLRCTAAAQQSRKGGVPLAYVRSLVQAPVLLATPPDPPLPSRPRSVDRKAVGRWEAQAKARAATESLRAEARNQLDAALAEQLQAVGGIVAARGPGELSAELASKLKQLVSPVRGGIWDDSQSFIEVFAQSAGSLAGRDSDSCLFTVMDRFGNNTGLEREVWMRVIAWLWKKPMTGGPGTLLGPFFAVGRAVAGRKLIGKGYGRTDDQLVRDAAAQAAGRLAGTLETGRQPLFMEDCRVAVIPALVPASVEKSVALADEGGGSPQAGQTRALPVSSLSRQSDVLFQPETSPVAFQLDPQDVARALPGVRFPVEEVWQGGRLDRDRLDRIAAWLRVGYLFLSRVRSIELSDSPDLASDAGQLRPATKRQADVVVEGALYGAGERAVIWQDVTEGGTIAMTEYVRHEPRMRTDEQCVDDAARTAYAHLRASFEEFKRKADRDTVTAGRAKRPGPRS